MPAHSAGIFLFAMMSRSFIFDFVLIMQHVTLANHPYTLGRVLVLGLGLILLIDGLALIALNKSHFGVQVTCATGIFLTLSSLYGPTLLKKFAHRPRVLRWIYLGWTAFWLWLASVIIFFIFLSLQSFSTPQISTPRAIIVLGSGVENGQPSAILAERLNSAAYYAQHHPQALIILSGGLDAREQKTEAEVMAQYLQRKYPMLKNPVALENRSTSTELNLKNSRPILEQQRISLQDSIVLATSDFHILRSKAIAHKQGYQQPIMLSAPTPLLSRYNTWLREYFAFISGWILREY